MKDFYELKQYNVSCVAMKMINVKSDDNSLPSIAASQKDDPNLKEEVPDCEEPRSSNDDGQKD